MSITRADNSLAKVLLEIVKEKVCIACEYKSVVEAHNVDEIVAHTTKMFSAVCDYLGAAISAKVLERDSENESTNENTATENATFNGEKSTLCEFLKFPS